MRTLALLACVPHAVAAAGCPGLGVEAAWIREMPPGAAMTAGYARLRNSGSQTLRIDGAHGAAFAAASLHRTVVENGVSRMIHGPSLELAPGASAELEPGGWHLMLMRPTRALQAGDTVPLALSCGTGSAEFVFTVKAPE